MASNSDGSPDGCDRVLDDVPSSVLSSRLETESVDETVEIFSTLGSETRYRVFVLLGTVDEEVCVCDIEDHLQVGQSAISQALSRLRKAGLVTRRKDGRWRYYTTTPLGDGLLEVVLPEADLEREVPAQ